MQFKTILLSLAALAISLSLGAQAKIDDKVVTSDYNRNSLSMVNILRGDSYDSYTQNAVSSFNPGDKFDINNIRTKSITIRSDRDKSVSRGIIDEEVNSIPFAREILASIFNRDSRGMMDDKTVRYRGNYDAKDQDVINARASRVGEDALGDLGHALVKGSYIVLTDFYNFKSKTDKQGKVTYSTNARGVAYKIDLDDNSLYDFYEKCWIYDDDDQATRDAKIRAFQNLDIPMVYVASTSTSSSGNSYQSAASSCLRGIITGLENEIPQWEVAGGIIAVKPVRAKIGTKEGLKNGDRYRTYSYTEDKNGNLKSVPRGFLRATEVSNNTGMSMGATEPSKFYQISGLANVEEGWTLKQSNDLSVGIALGYRMLAPGKSGIGVDLDYLSHVTTGGSMSYFLLSGNFDLEKADYTPISVGLGFGYGLHLTRFFELMPYGLIGFDHIGYSSTDTDQNSFMRSSALLLEPGLKFGIDVAYPLQIYAKAFYDLIFLEGQRYTMYKNAMYGEGHNRSGFGLQFGLKWTL